MANGRYHFQQWTLAHPWWYGLTVGLIVGALTFGIMFLGLVPSGHRTSLKESLFWGLIWGVWWFPVWGGVGWLGNKHPGRQFPIEAERNIMRLVIFLVLAAIASAGMYWLFGGRGAPVFVVTLAVLVVMTFFFLVGFFLSRVRRDR